MQATKYLIFLIAILFFSCSKETETTHVIQNVHYYYGSAIDKASGIVSSSDNGYAITGTILTKDNIPHAYLLKTSNDGNEENFKILFENDTLESEGNNIAIDNDGNFLIVGTIDNNSTLKDIFVSKMNSSGELIWTKTFGGNSDEEGRCVTILSSGNILIGGYSKSIGNGGKDAWVLEIDKNGDNVWQKTYGYAGDDICHNLVEMEDCYLLTGVSNNTGYTPNRNEVFLVKLNKSFGGITASVRYGTIENCEGIKSITDTDKNIYVLTSVEGSSSSNYKITKFKNDFYQTIWDKATIENNLYATDMLLVKNKLVVTGYFISNSEKNYLVNLLDTDGNFDDLDINSLKALGNQTSYSSACGNDGFLTLTGSLETGGFSKISLLKLDVIK